MLKSKITKATINELVKLYLDYKRAKNLFENFKKKVCTTLIAGRYEGDEGFVEKVIYDRSVMDMDKLKKDYPKINFDKYRVTSETEKVTVGVNKV